MCTAVSNLKGEVSPLPSFVAVVVIVGDVNLPLQYEGLIKKTWLITFHLADCVQVFRCGLRLLLRSRSARLCGCCLGRRAKLGGACRIVFKPLLNFFRQLREV